MEFQAVICCGKGNNLSPLSEVRQSGIPKALIPIANRPMIHYSLEWCDEAIFDSILIVTDVKSKDAIENSVKDYEVNRKKDLSNKLEVIGLDIEGTGSIVKALADQGKITKDFILLPCDFVTNLPPQILIEQFRNREDDDIGMCVYYKNNFPNIDEKKNKLKRYYTFYTTDNYGDNHLLDVYSKASIEKTKFLNFRTQMVWRKPKVKVSAKLLDSFIYFCSYKIIEILKDEKYDFEYKSCTKIMRDLARRSWKHSITKESINMLILPEECTFARADNIGIYLETNRWIMQKEHIENVRKIQSGLIPPIKRDKDKSAPNIGPESKIGKDTIVDEKTNIKKTIVGNACKIGKRCRIAGSVILNKAIIGDDVILENCIIGQNVTIESKAKLINCNAENNYIVPKGKQLKGETLLSIQLTQYIDDEYFEFKGGPQVGSSAIQEESEFSDEDDDEDDDDDNNDSGSDNFEEDFDEDLEGDDLFER